MSKQGGVKIKNPKNKLLLKIKKCGKGRCV